MKLNLACGKTKIEGWVNVDIGAGCEPDVVADVLSPEYWDSLGDNLVEAIHVSHFLEHIPHHITRPYRHDEMLSDGLIWFMDQCYRVLVPGGVMTVHYPHHQGESAYADPTHTRFLTRMTFAYFSAPWRKVQGLDHYPIRSDFEIEGGSRVLAINPNTPKEEVERMEMRDWNVVREVRARLVAVKPSR